MIKQFKNYYFYNENERNKIIITLSILIIMTISHSNQNFFMNKILKEESFYGNETFSSICYELGILIASIIFNNMKKVINLSILDYILIFFYIFLFNEGIYLKYDFPYYSLPIFGGMNLIYFVFYCNLIYKLNRFKELSLFTLLLFIYQIFSFVILILGFKLNHLFNIFHFISTKNQEIFIVYILNYLIIFTSCVYSIIYILILFFKKIDVEKIKIN